MKTSLKGIISELILVSTKVYRKLLSFCGIMKVSPPYPAKRIGEQTGLGHTFLKFASVVLWLLGIQRAGIALGSPKCFGIWFSETI